MVKHANASGKNDSFAPVPKQKAKWLFEKRMEEADAFFKTEIGREYKERLQMCEEDINIFNVEDYSPPVSPLRVQVDEQSYRHATANELEDWKELYPKDYNKRQLKRRVSCANALIAAKKPRNVAWAIAFKKYPDSLDLTEPKPPGSPSFVFPPKQ